MAQILLQKHSLYFILVFLIIALVGCASNIANDAAFLSETPMPSATPVLSLPPTTTPPINIVTTENLSFVREPKCKIPLYDNVAIENYIWSPNGSQVFLFNLYDIYLFDLNTSSLTGSLWPDLDALDAVFSPDGKQIAFVSYSEPTSTDIYLYDREQQQIRELINHPVLNANTPIWSPDAQSLAYMIRGAWPGARSTTARIWVFDFSRNEQTLIPLPEDRIPGRVYPVGWSADSQWIAYVAGIGDTKLEEQADLIIFLASADGQQLRQLTTSSLCVFNVTWSPDGQKLAFSAEKDGEWNIYTIDIETEQIKQLTQGSRIDFQPSWSLDSKRLVFVSVDLGESRQVGLYTVYQQDIYQINADGTNLHPLVLMGNEECCLSYPVWVPGQDAISFLVEVVAGCPNRRNCPLYLDVINSDGINRQRLVLVPKD